jgi:hypothetical protein
MLQHLHLYRPHPFRPVWIYYICISQQDTKEKAIQIPLMHRIYSRATLVVILMGLSEPCADTFMAEFPCVSEIARTLVSESLDSWTQSDPRMPGIDDSFWLDLFRLINNEWSKRLWIFQESVVAKEGIILCGSSWVDYNYFIDFILDSNSRLRGYILSLLELTPGASRPSHNAWEAYATVRIYLKKIRQKDLKSETDVSQLIDSMRNRRSQGPVDRVWAIIGLFNEHVQWTLASQIDYSHAGRTRYWKSYIHFAKSLMATGNSLSLLCVAPTVEQRPDFLPSWCPNIAGRSAYFLLLMDSWTLPVSLQRLGVLFEKDEDEEKQVAMFDALEEYPDLNPPNNPSQCAKMMIIFAFVVL